MTQDSGSALARPNEECGPGSSHPLGATLMPDGVNFSIYSKNAVGMELLLFDHVDDGRPARVIALDRKYNRTFHYWHVCVPGVKTGQLYGYRALGPHIPERGLRFDSDKVLLDPYGRLVATPANYDREAASQPGDNAALAMKSVVVDLSQYDWEDDRPLRHAFNTTIIYEMHVGGFTRNPNSGVSRELRGSYAGLVEKIPYLQDLGITAVELLPVFAFDVDDAPFGLTNYWGYSPISFFAPHAAYSSHPDLSGVLDEFRDMVKALHRANIEVILDVVYNHTAEGDREGPTFCFRGLENETYYILDQDDKSIYANYSGTGNTLNANNPFVRRMIIDSLRYWVEEMHVDGFRFDLASILSRSPSGELWPLPPIVLDIDTCPVLAGTKLIAEAWDAAGLYQVGSFVGDHWMEWNGQFRDDMRSFMKGDEGMVGKVAARFLASPDLYGHEARGSEQSINFVTSHDGFTLNDLVSYNEKHNEANREGNRDGDNDSRSWNCGAEGPTDDPAIEQLRNRQVKNFLAINLMALGVPMLLMGDEVRRTQRGNNNAYCQDSEISWFDWSLLEAHADVHRFARHLIHLRTQLDIFQADINVTLAELLHFARLQWHGVNIYRPDWTDSSHALSFTARSVGGRYFHIIFNAYWEPTEFEIPIAPSVTSGWRRIVDTALPTPEDFCERASAPILRATHYRMESRSILMLVAEAAGVQE